MQIINRGEIIDINELPAGFGMELAKNENAMKRFEKMSETEKAKVVEHARSVGSQREMQILIYDLSKN